MLVGVHVPVFPPETLDPCRFFAAHAAYFVDE